MKKYDIVIAGAGSAGFTAAVQAGRLGKSVLLIEKNGMPGGILTVGGNSDIAQFYAHQKQVIAGIGWEYVKRLEAIGGAEIPDMTATGKPHWYYGVHVNIPLAASMMDEMLLEAGVDICYEQFVCAAKTEPDGDRRRLTEVTYTSKTGLVTAEADTFIDCTGDGDLSVFAGADYECGSTDGMDGKSTLSLQPSTLRAYVIGPSLTAGEYAKVNESLKQAVADGRLKPEDTRGGSFQGMVQGRAVLNHVTNLNGADSHEKTLMDIEGRRSVARLIQALRGAGVNPDFVTVAPETAVRETRRIVCDKCITADEYVSAARYPDGICHSFYPIDLHREGGKIYQIFLTDGQVPSIPLSAMTVSRLSNLFVAGRCAYGDRLANSAYRVKASCMAMGQACGAAAALAVDFNNGRTRGIDFLRLRAVLAENGAILPPPANS